MWKNLAAPEGFKIEKNTDVDAGENRYVFTVDRSYVYRTSALMEEVSISEEWIDEQIVHSGMGRLVEDLERIIAKYKETKGVGSNGSHAG